MAVSLATAEQEEYVKSTRIFPSDCCVLSASGRLTMAHVQEDQEALVVAFKEHSCIVLDLSFVSEMDFFGLQLLLALRKSSDAYHKTLIFHDPNLLVSELIDFLHAGESLMDTSMSE